MRSSSPQTRALAVDTLIAYRDSGIEARTRAERRGAVEDHGVRGRGRGHGRIPAVARGGARVPRRGPPRAGLAHRRRHRLLRRDHRRRHVGTARRASPAAGRHAVRRPREGPRRRRHVVREHVSRVPRRQPEPQLQLLVRAAARLAVPLLDRRTCCSATSATCADEFGLREHIRFEHRGRVGAVRRGHAQLDAEGPRTPTGRRVARRQRGDQRGRPAQPTEDARDRRASTRSRARRSTRPRWDHSVDLARQARRRDRHRRAAPRSSSPRSRAEVGELTVFQRTPPWFGADAATTTTTSPTGSSGSSPTCPPTASGIGSGSSGGWATALLPNVRVDPHVEVERRVGERDQRLRAAGARRVPEGRVRRSPRPAREGRAHVSAGRQADARRQRHLGPHAEARQRAASSPTTSREITPKGVVTADGTASPSTRSTC